MKVEEIEKYLVAGSGKSVCIYRALVNQYPGYVLELTIQNSSKLKAEFNVHGYDEGGLTFMFSYENLSLLISSVENFLGTPLDRWENYTKSGQYPELSDNIDFGLSRDMLKRDLVSRKVFLPEGWISKEIPEGYWKRLSESRAS